MAEEKTPNPFNVVFEWFSKDVKVAVITCLIVAVIYQWYQNGSLMQARIDDKEKFKEEIIKEVRRAYDPKFKEMKDTILSKSANLDTASNKLIEYIDNKNK